MIITLTAAGLALVLGGVLGVCQAARFDWHDDDALRDAGFTQDDIDRMHREWSRQPLGRRPAVFDPINHNPPPTRCPCRKKPPPTAKTAT